MRFLVICNILVICALTTLFRFPPRDQERRIVLHEVCRITGNEGDTVMQVGVITSDSKGNLYMTDEYQWAVKKYSADGRLIRRYGRRGKDLGAFHAGPALVDCIRDTLAVVEMGSSRVQFLTTDFHPVREAYLPGAILALKMAGTGQFYAATVQPPSQFDKTLALYTTQGRIVSAIPLEGGHKDPILDMTSIAVDRHNFLVVAYRFINSVMLYDEQHRLVRRFAVPGLPTTSAPGLEEGKFTSMPDDLIRAVALDGRGNIFILGGMFSTHPNRDVVVLNYEGQYETTLLLPQKSGALFLDKEGNLYTRENQRTVVMKYRMEYINF